MTTTTTTTMTTFTDTPFAVTTGIADDAFVGHPRDFDFLAGRWEVTHGRLRERHVGCTDWETFHGMNEGWSLHDGQVSVDEATFEGKPTKGATVRTLDVAAARWMIYWISSADGRLQPPVRGGWCGDVGRFWGDDRDGDRPVRVRFLWEKLGPQRARWSQEFALAGVDGAADGPWERNWVMDFRKLPG